MPTGPTHAIVAVTYRCNARCSMCDIWKKSPGRELSPADYSRLPASLREVNVTGGEPLLRDDLADVIRAIRERCRGARIVLSTNGLLPSRLRAVLADAGHIAVRVSLDGPGQIHDRIRGIQGAYNRVLESLEVARELGVRDTGVCATMSRHNAGTIKDVQSIARDRKVQFTFTVAHSSPVFFGEKRSEEPLREPALRDMREIQSRLFASGRPKDWFKAYFVQGMMGMIEGRPRPIRCRAGVNFFYLDPEGWVYPCHLWAKPIGNILEKTYEQMVAESREALREAGACTRKCWMTCTVAPEMRRRLPVYAARVGWAKALHHIKAVAKPR